MNSKQFSELLGKINACREAHEWAKGKTLQKAWKTCYHSGWMKFLLHQMVNTHGWMNREQLDRFEHRLERWGKQKWLFCINREGWADQIRKMLPTPYKKPRRNHA